MRLAYGVGWMVAACAGSPPDLAEPEPRIVVGAPGPLDSAAPIVRWDTGPAPDGPKLLIPERSGIVLMALDGTVAWQRSWSDLVGPCAQCGGEGASVDADGGLLVSFTTRRGPGLPPGAVARLHPSGELDFRVDGFGFPHDVIRDPADDSLLVVETSGNKVSWIDGAGGSSDATRGLSTRDDHFGSLPNGAERFDHEGRSYLLLSHRGSGSLGTAGGLLTLWDITSAAGARLVWRFPEEGVLDTPHGPVFRVVDGIWWLLYAHTFGRDGNGTVGMAATADPTVRPTYVADLEPGDDVGAFGFLRGVELHQGTLYLTDTVQLGIGPVGRVVAADWPELSIPDTPLIGDRGHQTFVPLGEARELLTGLDNAFEGWIWEGTLGTKKGGDVTR